MDNMIRSGYRCKTGESLENDKMRFYKSQRFLATITNGVWSYFINEGEYKKNRYKLIGMFFITELPDMKTLWN